MKAKFKISTHVRRASKVASKVKGKASIVIFTDWFLEGSLDWARDLVRKIFSGGWSVFINEWLSIPGVAALLIVGIVLAEWFGESEEG